MVIQLFTCKRMQNLIKIYHVVQGLWPSLLTGNGRTDGQTDRRTHTVLLETHCVTMLKETKSATMNIFRKKIFLNHL